MSGGNDRKRFSLPKTGCWAIHKSKTTGKYYYYDIISNKSYWKRPKDLTDNDLREINFPEGYVIPEEVNAELTPVTTGQPEQPESSKKNDKSLAKVQKNAKKCGKNTANASKDREENTVKQCKTCKLVRKETRKKIKEKLQKGRGEKPASKYKFPNPFLAKLDGELPDYTDSDEEEPVAAKKSKTNDNEAKESQTENSEEKDVDEGQSVSDNRELVSDSPRAVAVTNRELISDSRRAVAETNDEVEEMDWSPDPTNNNVDEVETESHITEWLLLENEITPMDIDIASPTDTCLVIDTNILIHDMKLVESITTSNLADGSKIIVIIPWQVLKELDGLKKSSKVGQKCTTAVRFLHRCFSDKSSNVLAQNAVSEKLGRDLIEIEVPDDNIIACCLQIVSLDRRTVLLTNDINLCNKAMAHGIEAYTREEFLKERISLGLSTTGFDHAEHLHLIVRHHVFGGPPPPPIENVPYSVKKNLLARKYRNCPLTINQKKLLANPPAVTRHQTKETGGNSGSGSPPLTRTVFNPSAIPLNSLPNNDVSCNENSSIEAAVEKPPLPPSVLRNMLPRKKPKSQPEKGRESTQAAIASSSSGLPEKSSGNSTQKRPISHTIPNPALKSPANRAQDLSQVRPPFQVQETSSELINLQSELLEYVKLSSADHLSKSWDKFIKFKIVVAEFIFSILKRGMCGVSKSYGQWTEKIIVEPPWTVQQLCFCLRTHWLPLTGHFPSQQILERLQCLEESISDIDNKDLTLENLNMAINICFTITPPLKNNFKDLVDIFEAKLNSLLTKLVGSEEASHQYWSCFTEDVDSSRCLDLLSKMLNDFVKSVALLEETFEKCCDIIGSFDFYSPWVRHLVNLREELWKKVRPCYFIFKGLKAIVEHGSNVPQEPIDNLTLCLIEESEDPFFSKDDVIGLAFEPHQWDSVLEYEEKFDNVWNKMVANLLKYPKNSDF
ncbi:hypothetical protein LSTR_LSTR002152 [Laodelphax striatellus]|uniref:WW domain-containing protein n=1 Tax=Laodelphax striatellus TaxID=195883 RepID=A0A482XQP5_LAOST|nr:hypothetical protein LSTR_LSTR002152 [Laodelphax striatellus]